MTTAAAPAQAAPATPQTAAPAPAGAPAPPAGQPAAATDAAPPVDTSREFVALTKRRQDIAKREAALAEVSAKHEATARELADLAQFAKTFETDPIAAWDTIAKRSGKDPDELYEALSRWKLNRGKAPTDDRVAKLEAKIEADRVAAAEREAAKAEAEKTAQRRQAAASVASRVVAAAAAEPGKYEALAGGFTEAEIADAIFQACAEKVRMKESFTTEGVLGELESRARALRDRWKPSQPAASSGATKNTEAGKAAAGATSPKAVPRTIPASEAATSTTGAKRAPYKGAHAHRAEVLARLT